MPVKRISTPAPANAFLHTLKRLREQQKARNDANKYYDKKNTDTRKTKKIGGKHKCNNKCKKSKRRY
jgi:hypothetical protein